ncbi:MAG: Hint domain-containing protein [Rhodobacterales bacterium]|nr:Hint domain-containing protein [Rhodobacterales bacterium]
MRSDPVAAGGAASALVLPAGTEVITLDGLVPVDHVLPGDRLICREGAVAVHQVLAQRADPGLAVRFLPGALGAAGPDRTLRLRAGQPVRLRGGGAGAGLVAASSLADGRRIRVEALGPVRLITLVLPRAVVALGPAFDLGSEQVAVPESQPSA